MPTAALTTATVQIVGRLKQSKYEGKLDYRPVLFKLSDGTEQWKSYNEGSVELDWLRKGQTYQAAIAGDDFTLIHPAGTTTTVAVPATQPPQPQQGMTPDVKREIAQYITKIGDLYAYCLETAQNKVGSSTDSETVRCMASSLLIQCCQEIPAAGLIRWEQELTCSISRSR